MEDSKGKIEFCGFVIESRKPSIKGWLSSLMCGFVAVVLCIGVIFIAPAIAIIVATIIVIAMSFFCVSFLMLGILGMLKLSKKKEVKDE